MARAKPFVFGSLLGAIMMFAALQYHVVRSHDGFQFVPRTPQHSLGLAYADIRQWNASQWADRTELARALMAHGSGDLISQSVAESLADSVSSERATLEQLKSFMNKPFNDEGSEDSGLFQLPVLQPTQPNSAQPDSSGGVFAIPFPQEASKSESAADPFRVARTPDGGAAAPAATSAPAASRFSASDFIRTPEPLSRDSVFSEIPAAGGQPAANSAGSASSGAAAGSVRSETSRYADAVENAIFGTATGAAAPAPSVTAPRPADPTRAFPGGSPSASSSAKPAASTSAGTGVAAASPSPAVPGSSTAPAATSSPFGDVTADLESRARSALSRAQSSLTTQATQALEQQAGAASQYVRERLPSALTNDALPGRPIPGTAADSSGTALDLLREKFDPFIE